MDDIWCYFRENGFESFFSRVGGKGVMWHVTYPKVNAVDNKAGLTTPSKRTSDNNGKIKSPIAEASVQR
jgi:hypothetical protein